MARPMMLTPSAASPGAPVPLTAASQSSLPSAQRGTLQRTGSAVGSKPKGAGAEKWGMAGLLNVIRMTDPDLNTLALGTDLTTLGLNLNSPDMLYATFAYPAADMPVKSDPDYVLPYSYYMQPPPLKISHLSKFTLETLFYVFYNMPKDILQVHAAKELHSRDWRFHKELKLWLTKNKEQPSALAPPDKQMHIGEFVYFDVNAWEKKPYKNLAQLNAAQFMTDEELAAL
jgi:CCR4-NOT transcription complex subunit 2